MAWGDFDSEGVVGGFSVGRLGVIDIRDIRGTQAEFLMLIQNSLRSKYIIERPCSLLIWPLKWIIAGAVRQSWTRTPYEGTVNLVYYDGIGK